MHCILWKDLVILNMNFLWDVELLTIIFFSKSWGPCAPLKFIYIILLISEIFKFWDFMKMALSIYVDLLLLNWKLCCCIENLISGRFLFWPVLPVIPVAPKLSYCNIYQSFRYQGVFDDNCALIFLFSLKPYVMTPDLNRLVHMVQMKGHNMFLCRINRNYS